MNRLKKLAVTCACCIAVSGIQAALPAPSVLRPYFVTAATEEEEDRKVRMQLLVNNIIASMTETCKNILHGYYWDDLSTSTIADLFSFSDANSVKAQKYKCVKKFRDKYNELKGKIYG